MPGRRRVTPARDDGVAATGADPIGKYVFIIRSGGQMLEPPRPVLLDHDEAALGYACEMANKLRKSGRYNDPGLVVSVMDQYRPMIFSVPLLAACARTRHTIKAVTIAPPTITHAASQQSSERVHVGRSRSPPSQRSVPSGHCAVYEHCGQPLALFDKRHRRTRGSASPRIPESPFSFVIPDKSM